MTQPQSDFSLIFNIVRPVVPKMVRAALVMALSVVLIALVPLALSHIKTVMEVPPSASNSSSPSSSSSTSSIAQNLQNSHSSFPSSSFFRHIILTTQLYSNFFLAEVTDIFADPAERAIILAGLLLLALLMSHSFISFVGHYLVENAAVAAANHVRMAILKSSLRLRWTSAVLGKNPSVLAAQWLDSVAPVHMLVSCSFTNTFPQLVNFVVTAAALWWIAPRVAGFMVGAVAVFAVVTEVRRRLSSRQQRGFVAAGAAVVGRGREDDETSAKKDESADDNEEEEDAAITSSSQDDLGQKLTEQNARIPAFVTNVIERFVTVRIFKGQALCIAKFSAMLDNSAKLADNFYWYVHGTLGNTSRLITVSSVLVALLVVVLQRRGHISELIDFAVIGFYAQQLVTSFDTVYSQVVKMAIELTKVKPLCDMLRSSAENCVGGDGGDYDVRSSSSFSSSSSSSSPASTDRPLVVCRDVGVDYRSHAEENQHHGTGGAGAGCDNNGTAVAAASSSSSSSHDLSSPVFSSPAGGAVLRSATLRDVHRGDLVLLRSSSGGGKTTLLRCLAGLLDARHGQLEVNARRVAFLEQAPVFLAGLTVAENIAMQVLPPRRGGGADAQERRAQLLERVEHAVDRACAASVVAKLPRGLLTTIDGSGSVGGAQVSGGELQRLCVARMLFFDCDLLLADEPTSNLDPENARSIFRAISEMCERRSCAAIVATHDQFIAEGEHRVVRFARGVAREGDEVENYG